MAGWFAERKVRRQERAKTMATEARDIMKSVESPYTATVTQLSEYEKAVKFNPGSAYRHAKKAYRFAVTESEAARIHGKAVEVLDAQKRMDERRISSLDSTYRSCLARGKMRKAASVAQKMYVIANSNPDPSIVSVTMDDVKVGEGTVDIIITNRGEKPVVINSIACSCGTTELFSERGMSEACQPGAQTRRTVKFDSDVSLGITAFVEYECGFDREKIRRQFSIINQVRDERLHREHRLLWVQGAPRPRHRDGGELGSREGLRGEVRDAGRRRRFGVVPARPAHGKDGSHGSDRGPPRLPSRDVRPRDGQTGGVRGRIRGEGVLPLHPRRVVRPSGPRSQRIPVQVRRGPSAQRGTSLRADGGPELGVSQALGSDAEG